MNGLKIFDDYGNIYLDTTDRLTRLHSVVTITAASNIGSGVISVPGMVDDGTWWCVGGLSSWGMSPDVTLDIQTNQVVWTRYNILGQINTTITIMRS